MKYLTFALFQYLFQESGKDFHEILLTPTSTKEVAVPAVRIIKKRNTANKKERRRTQSINNAFTCLREKIPNVPSDTKLSKVIIIHTYIHIRECVHIHICILAFKYIIR